MRCPFKSLSRDILILMRHHTSICPSVLYCAKNKSLRDNYFLHQEQMSLAESLGLVKRDLEILDFGWFSEVHSV